MNFWALYIGVIIVHRFLGGDLRTILLSVAFNNAFLLFGPLQYFDAPDIVAWVEENRIILTGILSCILAWYAVKGIKWLANNYK